MSYTSMEGLSTVKYSQMLNANNLANINTWGYKAQKSQNFCVLIEGEGYQTKAYSQVRDGGFDSSLGRNEPTNNPLDIALKGHGWIEVEKTNGEVAYTRRGDLRLNEQSFLVNGVGDYIRGESGRIFIPEGDMTIQKDGTINIVPLSSDNSSSMVLDRIKLVKPDDSMMVRRDDGLFEMKSKEILNMDTSVNLEVGKLEKSNVNHIEVLVNFINLQEKFNFNKKVMDVESRAKESSSNLIELK